MALMELLHTMVGGLWGNSSSMSTGHDCSMRSSAVLCRPAKSDKFPLTGISRIEIFPKRAKIENATFRDKLNCFLLQPHKQPYFACFSY